MLYAKSALKCPDIEIMSWQSWVQRLKGYTKAGRTPALTASKMISFYEYAAEDIGNAHRMRGEVAHVVPRSTPAISQKDMDEWVNAWTRNTRAKL